MELNLLVIRTKNPRLLAEFYEKIGLQFEYHQHGNGPFHYATALGKTVFEIYPFTKSQQEADKTLRLGFTVKNLDELIAKLKQENINILTEPAHSEWGYFAVIADPDGRKIELTEKG